MGKEGGKREEGVRRSKVKMRESDEDVMWHKHKFRTVFTLLCVADGARGRKKMKERTTVEGGIGDGRREACLDCTL